MTDIDNGNSSMVQRLSIVRENAHDTNYQTSHCSDDSHPFQHSAHTLFVNAAMEGTIDEYLVQPPCLTDLWASEGWLSSDLISSIHLLSIEF